MLGNKAFLLLYQNFLPSQEKMVEVIGKKRASRADCKKDV